jgi:ACS family glucarate transporter-like MFS transporter
MPQRYFIVVITAVAALFLYIDRVCFSTLADPVQKDLGLTDPEKEFILSAFFLTYALFQIPMGALADRFGARLVLALSIAAWSLVTLATGFAQTFFALVAIRLMLGITEAGAYPAAAGLIKAWARPQERGRFSSIVALGGRIGGAVAPYLTAALGLALVGVAVVEYVYTPAGPVVPPAEGEPPRPNWRAVFVVYGLAGVFVALLFWLFVRDRPAAAPATPEPAREPDAAADWHALPGPGYAGDTPKTPPTFARRLATLCRSRNMWLYGGMQFCVNIGWVFIITLLPSYLNQAFNVPLEKRGELQSMVLTIGLCGMMFGGVFTDFLRGWLGPRYGRSVPLAISLGGCSLAFLLIPALSTVWAVVLALGVMAFLVDLHNPTVWAFAQDVGGKNVGAALGFGNMWGNLGGGVSPVLLGAVSRGAGWDTAFIVCGCSFAVAAVCGFLLDATKPVDADDAV